MFGNMEYVYEVYRQRSFSKAAAKLYISQPSLSASIKKTEKRVGQQIFDRSTTPIGLTDCGREYIRAVEQMLEAKGRFETYLNDWTELKTGNLAVGASNFFASYILPPMLSQFKKQYPGVIIHLVEANTQSLERQLFDGTLDIIIDNYAFDTEVYSRHFCYEEQTLLVVPRVFATNKNLVPYMLTARDVQQDKHLGPGAKAAPLAWFQNAPFLFLRSGNDTRIRMEKICQEEDFAPNVILKLDQMATAYHIACQELGITLVSDTLVKKVKPDDGVVYFKLDSRHTRRNINFYYKNGKFVTNAMKAFMAMGTL